LQEAKLSTPVPVHRGLFGESVAISEDRIVVGAHGALDAASDVDSVHVFRRDGDEWIHEAGIWASDFPDGTWFGHSVAIDRDWLVVGAPWDSVERRVAGAAYVFHFDGTGWVEVAKLKASDAAEVGGAFGSAVDIREDVIVVGAFLARDIFVEQPSEKRTGAAYVFRRNGAAWVEEANIKRPPDARMENVGHSVSAGDSVVAVGTANTVNLYRYHESQWLTSEVFAEPAEHFAMHIAMEDGVVVAGAYTEDDADPEDSNCNSGSAFVIHSGFGGWTVSDKLLHSNMYCHDAFGSAVAVDAGYAAIGAVGYSGGSDVHSGATYIFAVDGDDCNGNGAIDECDIVAGISEDVNNNAVPDECEENVSGSKRIGGQRPVDTRPGPGSPIAPKALRTRP